MSETSVPISAKGPRHKNHSFNEIIPLRAANVLKQRTSEDAVWSREIQLGQCPQDVPLSTQAVVFIQVWWNQYKFLMKCSKDKNISDRSACSQLNITAFLKWEKGFFDVINDIVKSSLHETGFTTPFPIQDIPWEEENSRAVPDFIHWELIGLWKEALHTRMEPGGWRDVSILKE